MVRRPGVFAVSLQNKVLQVRPPKNVIGSSTPSPRAKQPEVSLYSFSQRRSLVREPAFRAWVPTRTMRGTVALSVQTSPGLRKSYSPCTGRNIRTTGARPDFTLERAKQVAEPAQVFPTR